MIIHYHLIMKSWPKARELGQLQDIIKDFFNSFNINVKPIFHNDNFDTLVVYYESQNIEEQELREFFNSLKNDLNYDVVVLLLENHSLNEGINFLNVYEPNKASPFLTTKDFLRFCLLNKKKLNKIYYKKVLGKFYNNFELLLSIKKFIENDLNVSESARLLYLHRNSLIQRLDKFYVQTGYDVRKFNDAFIIYHIICDYLEV